MEKDKDLKEKKPANTRLKNDNWYIVFGGAVHS